MAGGGGGIGGIAYPPAAPTVSYADDPASDLASSASLPGCRVRQGRAQTYAPETSVSLVQMSDARRFRHDRRIEAETMIALWERGRSRGAVGQLHYWRSVLGRVERQIDRLVSQDDA